ncbi:MAG: PEP-CTERM sorting domain-containing protein [Crocosphaera sp.]
MNLLRFSQESVNGSVVQDIGGVSRTLADMNFDFDLDTLQYTGIADNDFPVVQEGAASGITYNVGNDETFVAGNLFVDGVFDLSGTFFAEEFDLITEEVTQPVTTPEPTTLLGLLAFGSMGALARKRK